MSPYEQGMIVGSLLGAAIGFCACAICVAAGLADRQMIAPQEIDDLLESPQDNFDKRA